MEKTADKRTAKKDESHARILESAGSLVREKGIAGASVNDVMAGAGMTVGGFYAHFPSKRSLIAEAIKETVRQSRERLAAYAAGKRGADWLKAVARSYLSRAHRDNPEAGCPLPATIGEIARADSSVREALAEEIGISVEELASHLREAGFDNPNSEGLALMSTMVGGLTLARALQGTPLSDEVLLACREHIERFLTG